MPFDPRLARAAELLQEAADPVRIIVFGSHARGDARTDSDIDLLVVMKPGVDRVAEMVRLNRVLSPLRLPVDLLVVGEDVFRYWSDTPGNVYSAALLEGRVLYEQANQMAEEEHRPQPHNSSASAAQISSQYPAQQQNESTAQTSTQQAGSGTPQVNGGQSAQLVSSPR